MRYLAIAVVVVLAFILLVPVIFSAGRAIKSYFEKELKDTEELTEEEEDTSDDETDTSTEEEAEDDRPEGPKDK